MKIKCKIFGIGKLNKKLILIILGVFIYSASMIIEENSLFFADENLHPILYCLIYSLGLSLSFILLLIYKRRNKNKSRMNSEKIEQNYPNAPANNKEQEKGISAKNKFLMILFVSSIDYIAMFLSSYFWITDKNYINTWPVNIIFMTLFSYWILKTKLYKHHYLAIATIIIFGIIYNIIMDVFTYENITKNYKNYISFFFTEILFSLNYFLIKYLMHIKYMISYEILFYEGVFELALGIITYIITTSINKIDNFIDFCKEIKENPLQVLVIIGLIIINFLYNTFLFIIIDAFSPFHIFLSNVLSEFIVFIYSFFEFNENYDYTKIILGFILLILCLFMILVYIEIIELNFCGLSNMTIKNIELRARLDSLIDKVKSDDNNKKIDLKGNEYTIELKEDNFSDRQSIDSNRSSLNW